MLGFRKPPSVLAMTLLIATAAAGHAQTTLRYKFKEGDVLQCTTQITGRTTFGSSGKGNVLTTTQTMDMTWTVKSVDSDGTAQITVKSNRLRLVLDMPGRIGKIDYDSEKGAMPGGSVGKAIGPFLRACGEAEFLVTVDARGEITYGEVPQKVQVAIKGAQVPGLGELFSAQTLKGMVVFLILPKDSVAKGDTWDEKLRLATPFGDLWKADKCVYEGTVTKDSRKMEQIKGTADITADPKAKQPSAIRVKEAKGSGAAYFDHQDGRLYSLATAQSMTLEIGGQTVQMSQNLNWRVIPQKGK